MDADQTNLEAQALAHVVGKNRRLEKKVLGYGFLIALLPNWQFAYPAFCYLNPDRPPNPTTDDHGVD